MKYNINKRLLGGFFEEFENVQTCPKSELCRKTLGIRVPTSGGEIAMKM